MLRGSTQTYGGGVAICGVNQIDELMSGSSGARPLDATNADPAAIGCVQDFLICQGYKGLPGPLGTARGRYGPTTTQCVKDFQKSCGLAVTGQVDQSTLKAFVSRPASAPVASQGYLALVLDIPYEGMTRLMSLTSQFEGAGRFGAINANTDKAGLSYGLIQWAQKPLRLSELLSAFRDAEPQVFARIFGGGDAAVADGVIRHTAKPRGGTDATGKTVDPKFDLIKDPWLSRFRAAALDPALQCVQVKTANAAFDASLARLRKFAPALKSERAIAFMLDVANQHGDGGARAIYDTVSGQAGAGGEAALLLAIENESVRRVAKQFGVNSAEAKSTRGRRDAFRTSTLLRDAPFES
jgi:peptidoglycan hydrolase-like protein with peptidoglycan-binding domain